MSPAAVPVRHREGPFGNAPPTLRQSARSEPPPPENRRHRVPQVAHHQGLQVLRRRHHARARAGVTVVVGPNGSGKSTWSTPSAGCSAPRRPARCGPRRWTTSSSPAREAPALGRAEVSLTIDNSAGQLPIEFTEVTITRTLFRNGDSEYAINGVPCRLLDIQELLSDSGVGRQQHVIISQGQIDACSTPAPRTAASSSRRRPACSSTAAARRRPSGAWPPPRATSPASRTCCARSGASCARSSAGRRRPSPRRRRGRAHRAAHPRGRPRARPACAPARAGARTQAELRRRPSASCAPRSPTSTPR
jgi:hypothetical protein